MAQEWYLMNTNSDTVSGFESESFDDFAGDAFCEALNSSLGETVELCNYDLSERVQTRIIMQGNVHDTKLKTTQRMMLAAIGTCKDKQYVYYKNRYWLIVGLVDNNGIYEKAVLHLCNYYLTWMNDKSEIIQRWANVNSASQYNNGETGNRNLTLLNDQLFILLPNDDECVLLDFGKRFIIDRRCKIYEKDYDENVSMDVDKPLIVYSLTRIDSVLYDYQDSGHHELLVTQAEKRKAEGYYVIDGKGYWLCDIQDENDTINDKIEVLSSSIEFESKEIYDGLEPGVFIAKFYDSDGKEISVTPKWSINCDFIDDINIEYVDNSILLSVDNEKLVNKSFELLLNGDGYDPVSMIITIKAFI